MIRLFNKYKDQKTLKQKTSCRPVIREAAKEVPRKKLVHQPQSSPYLQVSSTLALTAEKIFYDSFEDLIGNCP